MNTDKPASHNPYVGPVPFVEGQHLFGRETDLQLLSDLLIAKRIVLMISPSGAGKTSLIQAALLPQIRKHFDTLPVVRLHHARQASAPGVNHYVLTTLQALESRLDLAFRQPPEALAGMTLAQYFRTLALVKDAKGRTRFPLLVFDQFEELFTLNRSDWQAKKDFLMQLGELLGGDSDSQSEDEVIDNTQKVPPVWALLAMREDHVAELEPYLDKIPTGLAYRYRLLPLEAEQALEAIHKPAPENFPMAPAAVLVDDLRQVLRSGLGPDAAEVPLGRFVEPLLLQVGCLRLWEQIVVGKQRPIAVTDVASSHANSEIDSALADYYADEVAQAAKFGNIRQRVLRDFIESKLLSRSGVRTRALRDPVQLGELDAALGKLIDRHILRTDISGDREWIELSHDRLVDPVCANNQAWREANLSLLQKQSKLWKDSGRPADLLFAGEKLDEAQRFADANADDLVTVDRDFLEESNKLRARRLEEKKNQEKIASMNLRLMKQRFWLGACMITAAIAGGWVFKSKQELATANLQLEASTKAIEESKRSLQKEYVESRFKEAALLVRDDNPTDGLTLLVKTNEEINRLHIKGTEGAFDKALIRVLGRLPPVEARLGQHEGIVKAVAFGNSGVQVLSGGWDAKLWLWSTASVEPTAAVAGQPLAGHSAKVSAVATNDVAKLAVSADEDGNIVLWKTEGANAGQASKFTWRLTREASPSIEPDAATGLAAMAGSAPDAPKTEVRARITSLALNTDGTLLAVSSRDKKIGLWNVSVPTKPRLVALFGSAYHLSEIQQVVFIKDGPDRGKMVTADWDGKVGIWSGSPALAAKPETALKISEPMAILALAVSPDGKWIFAGDRLGDLHLWAVRSNESGRLDTRVMKKQSRGRINAMAFSADGNSLFCVGEDSVLIRWNLPPEPANVAAIVQGIKVSRFPGWDEKLYSVATHPTREGVVVIGGSKGVMLVDTTRPSQLVRPILGDGIPSQTWLGLAASGDLGSVLALGPDARTVHILKKSADQYQPVSPTLLTPARVDGLASTRSGSYFAVQTCSGEVQMRASIESQDGRWFTVQPAGALAKKCFFKNALAFAPTGMLLAGASGPFVRLWSKVGNGNDGEPSGWRLESEKRFDKDVVSIAFNASGNLLAVGGLTNWMEVWQVVGNRIGDLVVAKKGTLPTQVLALAFSTDGQTLVSATENLELTAWLASDLKTRSSLGELHERAVDNIVVGQRDGVQTLFSVDREGQLVACFDQLANANCTRLGRPFGSPINGMAVSADGATLIVAGPGLFVWNLNRKDMLGTVKRLASEGR